MAKTSLDLGTGSVTKVLLKTAMPMVVAQVVNMLYNVVDRMFVGKIPDIGAIALGGIGIYLPISIIIMAFSLWIGGGGAPKAAILMGKQDNEEAEKILGCCVLPIVVLGILCVIILRGFGIVILPAFGATATNLPYALEYLNIIVIGIVFNMLTTGLNSFINTQGKTLIGMMSILIGAVVNIILDAVFILGMNMGVAGAAWATVIGQVLSALWVVGFLFSKKSSIRIRKENLIPDMRMLVDIMVLGIASFIMTAVESLVTIILNYVLKKYGAEALSGYLTDGSTLAISVSTIITMASSFILMPINGFTQGLQPVISFNYGAGNEGRVKKAIRVSCVICTAYATVLCGFLLLMPQVFAGMFTVDQDVIYIASRLLRIYVCAMWMLGIQSTIQQSFVARGMAKQSIMIAFARKALYVPLLIVLPMLVAAKSSMTAIYVAEPVSDIFAVAVTVIAYIVIAKKQRTNHVLDNGMNETED